MAEKTIEDLSADLEEAKAAIDALSEKNKQLISEKRKLQAKTQDLDEETYHKALDELESLRAKQSKLEKEYSKDKEKLSSELASKDAYLQRMLKDDGLKNGLKALGVEDHMVQPLKAMLESKTNLEQNESGYVAKIDGKEINDYLKEWSESDGAVYIPKPNDTGANAGGGTNNAPQPKADNEPQSIGEMLSEMGFDK
jgi:predicted RNase H-like nuclease (RuvC/YqgF family)